MSGTTLRFPYNCSGVSLGSLSVELINDGDLSTTIVNSGALRLNIYNPKDNQTYYAGGGLVADIVMYEDDYGYDLQFTVTDVDGDAFNLTSATVMFQMAKETATSLKVNGTCTLDSDPTTGQCTYTLVAADLDTPGNYKAELEITVSGKRYTIGDMDVEVKRVLPYTS